MSSLRLWSYLIIAGLAGALMPLSFAPFEYYWLAPLSLLVLLLVWHINRPGFVFVSGFIYGLGMFGVGVSWVFISMHDYGNASNVLSALITGLFVAVLALFPAITGYLLTKLFPVNKAIKWLIAFPCLWTLLEWIRSWIFTGFPWLLLGYSQVPSPLRGYAPVIGVYGVTFLVALLAGLLLVYLSSIITIWRLVKSSAGNVRHDLARQKNLTIFSLVFLVIVLAGGWGLTRIAWAKPVGNVLTVSLVQGNVPQSIKWSPDQAVNSVNLYTDLTAQHWQSDLIIWPENAITLLLPDATRFLEAFDKKAHVEKAAIITGIPIPESDDVEDNYYNGVIVLGDGEGHYLKRHLVPFGEYVPLARFFHNVLGFLNLPMSDFVPGSADQSLLSAHGILIAPYICYEVAFPALLRSDLPEANLLVTLSDDTWFGKSFALAQHRQIAQFAAQSTRRAMLVATNSGETVIINPQGQITAAAPFEQTTVLNGTTQGMTGATPWVMIGNTPVIVLLILLLFIAWFRRRT